MEQQLEVIKKRGRKPTKKLADKVPKKRGRKPKDKVGIITTDDKNLVNEENVILHLPIFDEIEQKPEPTEETTLNFMTLQEQQKINIIKKNMEEQVVSINKKETVVDELDSLLQKRENDLKMQNNTNKLMLDYVETNKRNVWPKSTKIPCLHDCHVFDGEPIGIPVKIEDNKCIMEGNYCSVSCAASSIFNSYQDSNIWEKYALLNYIYNNNKPIFIANNKLIIDTFGGKYSIEEYRHMNSKCKKVSVETMPFVASIPTVEETQYDVQNIVSMDIDKERLKKVTKDYKLKRNKPLPDFRNTLEASMNLKYV